MLDFSRTDSQSSSCSQKSAESKSQLSGRGSRGLGAGAGLVFCLWVLGVGACFLSLGVLLVDSFLVACSAR